MNVYDCANDLAKAMRESHEFKKLKEANEILAKDPETKKLVDEFLQLSQEIEIAKYQGQEP
ncbi:MAG: YlbF family regulator, partial [Acidaminococcaceae bacterium]|nr:YlbF family regulator [Acidaminococcaceae bacterium]